MYGILRNTYHSPNLAIFHIIDIIFTTERTNVIVPVADYAINNFTVSLGDSYTLSLFKFCFHFLLFIFLIVTSSLFCSFGAAFTL
nr:MAG TPA: hypothetical protein [Caudoviricetes sp.]